MTTLGFAHSEQDEILRMLAAVLHIGNINFQVKAGAKGGEASQVANGNGKKRLNK